MCSVFLLFPAAGGYERIGDWAYFLWRGLSLAYLALLVLTAAEVSLTGEAGSKCCWRRWRG